MKEETKFWSDLFPYSGGGFVIGALAIGVCLVVNVIVLFLAQTFSGSGTISGAAWEQPAVVLFFAFTVVFSLFVGRSLYRMRRWVGAKENPDDLAVIARKRRHFSGGAMLSYVALTPLVWVLMIAMAASI